MLVELSVMEQRYQAVLAVTQERFRFLIRWTNLYHVKRIGKAHLGRWLKRQSGRRGETNGPRPQVHTRSGRDVC